MLLGIVKAYFAALCLFGAQIRIAKVTETKIYKWPGQIIERRRLECRAIRSRQAHRVVDRITATQAAGVYPLNCLVVIVPRTGLQAVRVEVALALPKQCAIAARCLRASAAVFDAILLIVQSSTD